MSMYGVFKPVIKSTDGKTQEVVVIYDVMDSFLHPMNTALVIYATVRSIKGFEAADPLDDEDGMAV